MVEQYQYLTVLSLNVIFTVIACLLSILTLMLVRLMKKWNGYLAIITLLVCCQIVYDLTFYIQYTVYVYGIFLYFITGLNFAAGLAAQIWSNVLAVVILSVVKRKAPIDILKNFTRICACIFFPCFIVFIFVVGEHNHPEAEEWINLAYFVLRLASVFLNFFATGLTWLIGRQMRNTENSRSQCDVAILVLSRRMIYYPLVQAISRIPKILLDITAYRADGLHDSHAFQPGVSQEKYILSCFVACCNPMATIGYFIIFITMQPSAHNHLMSLITTGKPWRQKELSKAFGEIENGISGGADVAHSSASLARVASVTSVYGRERDQSQQSVEYVINGSVDISGMDEGALVQHILQSVELQQHPQQSIGVRRSTLGMSVSGVMRADTEGGGGGAGGGQGDGERPSRVRFSVQSEGSHYATNNPMVGGSGVASWQVFDEDDEQEFGDVSLSSRGSWVRGQQNSITAQSEDGDL